MTRISIALLAACLLAGQTAVTTGHYDSARTGSNYRETLLNPEAVHGGNFGFIASLPVHGCIASQPLYVPNVSVGGERHNVLYVATTSNTIYAFDADRLVLLALRELGTPVPSAAINPATGYFDFPNCDGVDEQGPVGVVGTPVIDTAAEVMYVVGNHDDGDHHWHAIYKLRLDTLADESSPRQIEGESHGVAFNSYYHLQRPALLLEGGLVYVAFASHTDATPYYGWLFVYDNNLQVVASENYSPEHSGAGIWQSGGGLAVLEGSIYFTTGNNAEGFVGNDDRADSLLRIDPKTLAVTGQTSFPEEANNWDWADIDLGSSRIVPIAGTPYAVAGSKYGDIFVVDRQTMQLVTRFQGAARLSEDFDWTGIYNGLAVWNHTLFLWPGGSGANGNGREDYPTDVLKSYEVNADGGVSLVALGGDDHSEAGYQGANLAVSSNGSDPDSAIVWADVPQGSSPWLRRGKLVAYAASSRGVFRSLWSDDGPEHDWAKFAVPTVVNGRVYLPTFSGQVLVYGLKETTQPNN